MTLRSSVVPCPKPAATSGWRRLAALLVALGILLAAAPAALAQPDITLDKQAPAAVLYGDDSTVTLRAANPADQPYGYNLSFRDVMPEGVSYVPGSASVAPRIIPNAPSGNQTTLIFENVSDLSPGSSYGLTYQVTHDTAEYAIGDTYVNQAGAYINEDPRFVPDFAPDGTPLSDYTGSATDTASTTINAIEIEKSEPSPEGELLRGVHDHRTVYTLNVRNNGIEPTTGLVVHDYLPAGLEFLGCGTGDNTTDAPTNPDTSPEEYAGSGPLNAGGTPSGLTDCPTPQSVETVLDDPDDGGPLPFDVYTHVVWSGLGEVPAGGSIRIQYVAAVPIRENTINWTSPIVPMPESLGQASNLDNNSGDETHDEQALTNYARVTGDYNGTLPVSDDHSITRSAEDLRVLKSVDLNTINQGQISTWSLRIDTSEYRYVDDVRVTDTLPDGLCPLGPANYEDDSDEQTECDPVAGQEPNAPYTDVEEAAGGTYSITWDQSTVDELERMQPSSSFTITFPTRTRAHYQENFQDANPVLAEDSWTNGVSIAGQDFRICAPADPDCTGAGTTIDGDEVDGQDDLDTSSAGQEAGGIAIDKKVREATPGVVDCATGTYVDGPPPNYGPGDTVCWQLRVDFASQLDTGEPTVTDFMPPGVTYVPGSAAATPNNTVSSTFSDAAAGNGVLTWDLGSDVPEGDLVFEWRFATTVEQGAGDEAGDLEGNLMKLSFANTPGQTFPLRDQVEFERSEAQLSLLKGVRRINTGTVNGPNVDGGTVAAGDFVEFRIDVTNDGDLQAWNAAVDDELLDGITCTDVIIVSHMGGCSGERVSWIIGSLAAGATEELIYVVEMPNWVEPGKRFDNTAEVVSYQSETNLGPMERFTYTPGVNAPVADDDSFVETRGLTFTKTHTTDVTEAGNNAASQATIGEGINYTMTLVIPEGTTIYDGDFSDTLGPRHGEMTSTNATLNGGPLPGGPGWLSAMDPTTGFFTVNFPGAYTNAAGSGDDTFVFTMSAPVADVAANRRTSPNETLTNTATFDWNDNDGTPHLRNPSVNTTIVEPNVSVSKDENDANDIVTPGQSVVYTVTARNNAGTRVSMAHDLVLVDHVPPGLTPQVPSISNGGTPGPRDRPSPSRPGTWTT